MPNRQAVFRPSPPAKPGGEGRKIVFIVALAFISTSHAPAADAVVALDGTRVAILAEIDGQPLRDVWSEAFGKLFRNLDRNGDGVLSRDEAARMPTALRVRQLSWGYFFAQPTAPVPWVELAGREDAPNVRREQVEAYYRRHGIGGIYVAWGRSTVAGPLTDALLKALDRDGDGTVREADWKAAEATLLAKDLNRDGAITPDELLPGITYATQANALLTADAREAPLAFADGTADHTLTVRLGKTSLPALRWDAAETGERGRLSPQLPTLRFVIGRAETKLPAEATAAWAVARQRFTEADTNADGSLTSDEAKASTFPPLRNLFTVADRDGDGRLTRAEWESWLDVQAALARATVVLSAVDDGAGLFELLDADRDGQLGPRELRNAWRRLTESGCIVGGRLERSKLPRQAMWALGQGRPAFPLPPVARTGPDWFRAMDRNNDGDLSRAEFLGSDEAFQKLDLDGDGLIDANEAAMARAPGAGR